MTDHDSREPGGRETLPEHEAAEAEASVRAEIAEKVPHAIAEGLHKAMCFTGSALHNRLACERAAFYLNLATAAVAHPAARAALAASPDPGTTAPLDVERLAINAAARLEGEVSRLRTELAACTDAYARLATPDQRHG